MMIDDAIHKKQKSIALLSPKSSETIVDPSYQIKHLRSPKIIETDRASKTPGHSDIGRSGGSRSKSNQKRKKKKFTDVKGGMNLTKILELKENNNNISVNLLADQTFSNLLMNEDDVSCFAPPLDR